MLVPSAYYLLPSASALLLTLQARVHQAHGQNAFRRHPLVRITRSGRAFERTASAQVRQHSNDWRHQSHAPRIIADPSAMSVCQLCLVLFLITQLRFDPALERLSIVVNQSVPKPINCTRNLELVTVIELSDFDVVSPNDANLRRINRSRQRAAIVAIIEPNQPD